MVCLLTASAIAGLCVNRWISICCARIVSACCLSVSSFLDNATSFSRIIWSRCQSASFFPSMTVSLSLITTSFCLHSSSLADNCWRSCSKGAATWLPLERVDWKSPISCTFRTRQNTAAMHACKVQAYYISIEYTMLVSKLLHCLQLACINDYTVEHITNRQKLSMCVVGGVTWLAKLINYK